MRSREYGDQYPSAAICPRLKIKKPCILICSSSILSRKFKIDVEGIPKFSGVVCENSLFLFIQFPFFMCNIYVICINVLISMNMNRWFKKSNRSEERRVGKERIDERD